MNEKEKTILNIIFHDKEFEHLIHEVARKACEKHIPIAYLNKAIYTAWKEELVQNSIKSMEFTPTTLEFSIKTRKFLKCYEVGLIQLHDQSWNTLFKICDEPEEKNKFFTILYQLIISIYIAFEKDFATSPGKISITQQKVIQASRIYFNTNPFSSTYLNILIELLYHHLLFKGPVPTYSTAIPYESLSHQDEFYQYLSQFIFYNTRTNHCSLALIWVITTFF